MIDLIATDENIFGIMDVQEEALPDAGADPSQAIEVPSSTDVPAEPVTQEPATDVPATDAPVTDAPVDGTAPAEPVPVTP